MTKRIWKYAIPLTGYFTIDMPEGATPLSVQTQGTSVEMWALVDPHNEKEMRGFLLFGTGHPVGDNIGRYIGTVQCESFVWHIFEEGVDDD